MIQNLHERTRYTRIAKFKIGQKETVERNGRTFEMPVALEYFRLFDGENTLTDTPVHKLYGDKPNRVLVYLPDNLSDASWDNYYKRYARSGLMCKGDGLVGQEVQQDGTLKPRDCATKGCPFALPTEKNGKPQPPACRPIGVMSFKVVDVPSAGVYQIDVKGMSAVQRVDSYLRQLQSAAGGDLTGIPFYLGVVVGKGKDGFPNSRIELSDAPETLEALRDPTKRQTAPTASSRVRGVIITSESGEVIASPEIPVEENVEVRAEYALLLNRAIEECYILGDAVEKYYQELRTLGSITEEEAAERLTKLSQFVQELAASADEPVSKHGETDQRYGNYAFKYLKPADYQTLGFEQPTEPMEFTRIQARRGVALLYQQRRDAR